LKFTGIFSIRFCFLGEKMMRTLSRTLMIIFLILLLASCQTQNPIQPNQPDMNEPVTTESPNKSLSLDDFKDVTLSGLTLGAPVQLKDGVYEEGSGQDSLLMQLLPQAAFGDLNNDGREDAVLLFSENYGGSGNFVAMTALLAADDGYIQMTPISIDDRPLIDTVTIEEGRIVLNATVHNINDAMVNPTKQTVQTYKVANGKLVLVSYASTIYEAVRTITIDTPTTGQEVSGTMQVTGSMPIAPFENTLVVRLYNANEELLSSEAFMVNAADMGAPATFDNVITLPMFEQETALRLELAELSMADGSTLCLNSVELIVR
jgi:hypothetical protein